MKEKIYQTTILILLILNITIFQTRNTNKKEIKEEKIITVMNQNQILSEQKISELNKEKNYKINLYYPYTQSTKLNKEIKNLLNQYKTDFLKSIPDTYLQNQYSTLNMTYTTSTYQDYKTYIFEFFIDTNGAHPNTIIETINYDEENDKIITIKDLVKTNKNILTILSEESEKQLLNNSKIQENFDEQSKIMILEGTKPTTENYKNFSFTKDGITIYFNRYQVAPYYKGSFQTTIPYQKLNLNLPI